MFKLIAIKILALLSITLKTPNNIELASEAQWMKVEPENSYQNYTLDSWENKELINQCKTNPDGFILIPPIYFAHQEIWDERNLIESVGNIRKDLLESGYISKGISCIKVLKSQKLIWKVYRLSPIYSKIKVYPTFSDQKFLSNSYGSLVFLNCSLILLGLSLFAVVVFRHRIANKVLFNYVGACVCISFYGLIFCSGLWSSGIVIHKYSFLIAFFLVLGVYFLSSFLRSQNYLPKSLMFYASFTVLVVILDSFLFYNEPKLFLAYHRLLCFPYFILFTSFYFAYSLLKLTKNINMQNLIIFTASTILLLSAINDILASLAIIKSDFIVQAGFLTVLSAHLYFFKNEVGTAMFLRDKYKQKLDEAYQEKLEIISKNTVAHTIANTVGRIAHDIKKPFHMIRLTFNELKEGRIDLQQTFDLATHVERTIDYVDNLLTDLMTTAREKPNKLEPLEINKLIESSWKRSNFEKDRIFKLELEFQHSNKIFADKLKIERLLINLFNNGKEAMGSHGRKIWVKTHESTINNRPYIEITIGNEDSFIAKEDRSKIFSPTYTSGKKNGTGLGLAICHETVISHGGQIRCESNEEKNTEFIFTLPCLSQSPIEA